MESRHAARRLHHVRAGAGVEKSHDVLVAEALETGLAIPTSPLRRYHERAHEFRWIRWAGCNLLELVELAATLCEGVVDNVTKIRHCSRRGKLGATWLQLAHRIRAEEVEEDELQEA